MSTYKYSYSRNFPVFLKLSLRCEHNVVKCVKSHLHFHLSGSQLGMSLSFKVYLVMSGNIFSCHS